MIGSPNAPAAEGIYRLDRVGPGTTRATLIADIYTWSEEHPPASPDFFVPGGFTYAMQPYRDGFLVTDAHHNRVLRVRLERRDQRVQGLRRERRPDRARARRTRCSRWPGRADSTHAGDRPGRRALARGRSGRAPRLRCPAARRRGGRPAAAPVRAGQGDWPYEGQEGKEGFPAAPNTGQLMLANRHGQFRSVVSGLDRPVTFEFIGRTAFVVTITGKVLRISGLNR